MKKNLNQIKVIKEKIDIGTTKKQIFAVYGNNFNDVNILALTQINPFDISTKNIIIVPDRSSLVMEKLIFETLAISSTMNINVMGISRFAKNIFKKLHKHYQFVTKNESLLLIRRALKNLKNQLLTFKGEHNVGLCDEIFQNISYLKSNEIKADQLEVAAQILQQSSSARLADLKIIYEEYDRLLGEKLDSTKMLEVLESFVCELNFNNTNVFFLNYDALTTQGYSILKALAKTNAKIFVGVLVPENQKNKFVFENDILEKLQNLAQAENFDIVPLRAGCTLNSHCRHINFNLFAMKPEIYESSDKDSVFLRTQECASKEAEIEQIAQKINYLILNNKCKYSDIALACSNLETDAPLVEKIFNEFGFSFYIDKGENIKTTQTAQLVLDILSVLELDFPLEKLKKFFCNPLHGFPTAEQNIIILVLEKYNIHGQKLFTFDFKSIFKEKFKTNTFFDIIQNLNELQCQLKDNDLQNLETYDLMPQNQFSENKPQKFQFKKISNKIAKVSFYCNFLRKIIKCFNIYEKNESTALHFATQNHIKLEKLYAQIPDKINEILQSLENILEKEEITFAEFVDMFACMLADVEISTVPISVNSVFVADATVGFFERVKYFFVCGANESEIPRYLSDSGVLSDSILNEISELAQVSPTVRMINRRNRFKIFNLLQNAQKALFVFYSLADHTGKKLLPSSFVLDLEKMFLRNAENNKNLNDIINKNSYTNCKKTEKLQADLMQKQEKQNKSCISPNESQITENINNCGNVDNFINLYDGVETDLKEAALNFAIALGNTKRAKHEFLKNHVLKSNTEAVLYNSLFYALDKDFKNHQHLKDYSLNFDSQSLLFPQQKTTVTQIETYLACPFKNFANYGLKLKEQETYEILPKDVGNILHKIAEEFLKPKNMFVENLKNNLTPKEQKNNLDKNLNYEKNTNNMVVDNLFNTTSMYVSFNVDEKAIHNEINLIVETIFFRMKNQSKFFKLNILENNNVVELLKKESTRLCTHLFYTQIVSKFKPLYLEEFFGSSNFPAYEFNVFNKKIKLVGVVDRVDVYNDMFVVIDYKSGGDATGGYPEIFYGDKIQIFVYLKILETLMGKKPCGAFYFPIKNQYNDGNEKSFMLKGKAVYDDKFLTAMDPSLSFDNPSSKILGLKISTSKDNVNSGVKTYNKTSTVSKELLQTCMDYSMDLAENVLKEILQGNIAPAPTEKACTYCLYKAICGLEKSQLPRKHEYEIKTEFFENYLTENSLKTNRNLAEDTNNNNC